MPNFFFLHAPTGQSWPTDNPHRWLHDNRDDDLLAAARERLVLSSDDPDRCLRVALRRCGLVLVQIVSESQIIVRHWNDPVPDVKVWAKEHGWNRTGVQVVLVIVKHNKTVVHENAEDVLMYGQRVGSRFPWSEYIAKHERRHIEEGDDQNATPASCTNFGWPTVTAGKITWRVLKAVWKAETVPCPNCDRPLVLTSVGWHEGPLSFRSARVFRHCLGCRRRFEAHKPEPLRWLASVLPPALRPTHLEQWRTFEIDWPRLAFKHHRPVQFVDREE